jgi:succinate dehydrogenase/fumarate reductase flavoprotein subunit
MKIERTWFAADKTGFHMLHTLFQTSLQFPKSNASMNTSSSTFWSTMVRPVAWWR